MDTWHSIALALIQGLTEFLPISSSAHLILPSELLGWPDQGLAFDVSVHVGTLIAVLIYFRSEVLAIIRGFFARIAGGPATTDSRMAFALIVGTIPAGVAGVLFEHVVETALRSEAVIATTTIVFGLLLGVADRCFRHGRGEVTLTTAIAVGFAQALALIPGTSRSGITMTAGLALGLSRSEAARFSFLLSIPIIAAAGLLKSLELIEQQAAVAWGELALAVLVSAGSAYLCIHWFLKLLERIGFMPFVIYRLLLGVALIAVIVWH